MFVSFHCIVGLGGKKQYMLPIISLFCMFAGEYGKADASILWAGLYERDCGLSGDKNLDAPMKGQKTLWLR